MAKSNPNGLPATSTPVTDHTLWSRVLAEGFGTFVLVFAGIGAALFAATFPDDGNSLGIGFVGVALAFGLAVVIAAYAVGHISGGHFNPAVTIGLACAGRFPRREILPYLAGQVGAGILATTILFFIAQHGPAGFAADAIDGGFASNGWGDRSPGGFDIYAVAITELVLTGIFIYVILGVTHADAPTGFGPLAIGLSLTVIHLVSIPISNTSVNPARSIATAIYGGPEALAQVWLFVLIPIVGGAIAGLTYGSLLDRTRRS